MSDSPASALEPAAREEEAQITSADGTALFVRRVSPEAPRARLAWVHGVAEHGGRYLETMRWFAQRGFASSAVDLRGHGHSAGRRVFVKRWAEYTSDVLAFLESEPDFAGPTFLIGHSMGGLVVARALQSQPQRLSGLKGAVVMSPFFGIKVPVPGWKVAAGRFLSKVVPGFSLPSDLDPDLLSKDPAMVRGYMEDPLVTHSVTARWYTEAMAQLPIVLDQASGLHLPLFLIHGEDDGITDPAATQRVYDRLSSSDKELVFWPSGRHELLNEVEREQIRQRLHGWLEPRIA